VIKGLFAAVATPVHPDGRPDLAALGRIVAFLASAGVDGICLGGATGEFPHHETADRRAVIAEAVRVVPDCPIIVGVGTSSMPRTIELGRAAAQAGSLAALLPMPWFFRYGQQDLHEYCAEVSRAIGAPCLLYDLPDFTNGLAAETVTALLAEEPFLVGIKDSSGRHERLERFAEARGERDWTLIVGDDRLLRQGLEQGWSGGISGLAGFCPELLVALHRAAVEGRREEAARLQRLLDELIAHVSVFPTPWAIRIGLEARGLPTGPLPLPLSAERRRQIAAFTAWFGPWLDRARPA
jgi:4-hydroxy-tetrahydrodipicolinate synthase